MFRKITSVEPLNNLLLKIIFENGITKIYDVKPLFKEIDEFETLKNPAIFNNVKVDTGGYGISWNDYLDLECTELWENGITEVEYKAAV